MASRKWKYHHGSDSVHEQKRGRADELCIIHFEHSTCESFQGMSDCKGSENRLEKLQDIARKRLAEPEDSPYRMEHSCRLLPEVLRPERGYYRDCHQCFTKNLDRLKGTGELHEQTRTSVRAAGTSEKVIFEPHCIFCNKDGKKKVKKKGIWTAESTTVYD